MSSSPIPDEDLIHYHAVRFLLDLKEDHLLCEAWVVFNKKLDDPNLPVKDKLARLQNFLIDHGYQTTAEEVLLVTKPEWWKAFNDRFKPTPTSTRFVQDVLQDHFLFQGYLNAAADALDARDASIVSKWLAAKGYECTPEQVRGSFQSMRNINFNLWAGRYGLTLLGSGDGAKAGPVLTISGDDDVLLDDDLIIAPHYAQGVLKWEHITEHHTNNKNGASLTFNRITKARTKDDYVGPLFSGQLIVREKDKPVPLPYSGRLGDPPVSAPRKKDPTDRFAYWFNIVNLGLGTVLMIGMLVHQIHASRDSRPQPREAEKDLRKRIRDLRDKSQALGESPVDAGRAATLTQSVEVNQLEQEINDADATAREALEVRERQLREEAASRQQKSEDAFMRQPEEETQVERTLKPLRELAP